MGTRPIIYKYPLDLTGRNPNNLVLGEPHVLPTGVNRAVVPNYGAFYSASLVVRDADSGVALVPHEQFKAIQLYQEATEKTGQEVTAALVVTDTNVSENIIIDYQAIGGEFSYSVTGLREMLSQLDIDNRPVRWGDILGKPNLYPAAPHLHDAGDLYGFEYMVEAIDTLRHAIMVGQEGTLGELRQYVALIHIELSEAVQLIDRRVSQESINTQIDVQIEDRLTSEAFNIHLGTHDPHGTNKYVLGLGKIKDEEYLTLGAVLDAFRDNDVNGTLMFDLHIGTTNPHYTNKDVLNLGEVVNGEYLTLDTTLNTLSV